MEYAYDSYELKPESIFLFKLFRFQFDYDDEARTCTVSVPISDFMYNPSGIVHGGVLAFLADTTMGHLNFRFKDNVQYVTLEMKTSYFKPAISGKLVATARYVKDGYKVCYIECDIRNEEGDLLCRTNGTFYRYDKKNT